MSGEQATPALRLDPDWDAAAQTLVDGCAALETSEQQVRFMDRVCLELGDQLYPAFLRLLCIVSDHGDEHARRAVAETMVHALSTSRMPSGRLIAWGGSAPGNTFGAGHTRSLGPIEYLCAWHIQQGDTAPLPIATFHTAATAVISLVSAAPQAQALYCAKLRQDIDDPLSGSLTRTSRAGLSALVSAWEAGHPADVVVQTLLDSLNGPSLKALGGSHGNWAGLRY